MEVKIENNLNYSDFKRYFKKTEFLFRFHDFLNIIIYSVYHNPFYHK